jgi:hypothetical protein
VWIDNKPLMLLVFVICHSSFFVAELQAKAAIALASRAYPGKVGFLQGSLWLRFTGFAVEPFEPDAGNAAEGSERWSCGSAP